MFWAARAHVLPASVAMTSAAPSSQAHATDGSAAQPAPSSRTVQPATFQGSARNCPAAGVPGAPNLPTKNAASTTDESQHAAPVPSERASDCSTFTFASVPSPVTPGHEGSEIGTCRIGRSKLSKASGRPGAALAGGQSAPRNACAAHKSREAIGAPSPWPWLGRVVAAQVQRRGLPGWSCLLVARAGWPEHSIVRPKNATGKKTHRALHMSQIKRLRLHLLANSFGDQAVQPGQQQGVDNKWAAHGSSGLHRRRKRHDSAQSQRLRS